MDRYARRSGGPVAESLEQPRQPEFKYNHSCDSSTAASSETETEVSFESLLSREDRQRKQKSRQRGRSSSRYSTCTNASKESSRASSRRRRPSSSSKPKSSSKSKNKTNDHRSRQQTFMKELLGLSMLGAFTGCLIGGPLCGAAGAGAAAVAVSGSHTKEVRGGGAHTRSSTRNKDNEEDNKKDEKEVNKNDADLKDTHDQEQQPKFSKRATRAIENIRERIKEFDEKNQLSRKVGESSRKVGESVKKFDEKHHILERASLGGCLAFAPSKYQSRDDTLKTKGSFNTLATGQSNIVDNEGEATAQAQDHQATLQGPTSTWTPGSQKPRVVTPEQRTQPSPPLPTRSEQGQQLPPYQRNSHMMASTNGNHSGVGGGCFFNTETYRSRDVSDHVYEDLGSFAMTTTKDEDSHNNGFSNGIRTADSGGFTAGSDPSSQVLFSVD